MVHWPTRNTSSQLCNFLLYPRPHNSTSSSTRILSFRRALRSLLPAPSHSSLLMTTSDQPAATGAFSSAPSTAVPPSTANTQTSASTVPSHRHFSIWNPLAMLNNFRADLSGIDMRTVACMALNFASSTFLVVLNKLAMDKFGFKFATTLTCFHLWCTFLLLLLSAKLGVFEIKKLPIKDVWQLAAGTMGFITLTNLSLQHNSVGFYQVMKVMTTPTVVIIEALLYQKYLENSLKLSLLPVCIGVIITTVTDFRLNLVGTGYAVAGVIVTSFYQIWSGTLQRSLDCNALQLQTYVAPLAALFLIPLVPIIDNWSPTDLNSIWFYNFTTQNLSLISVTGLCGFFVNISIFLVIGRSSPLSYNILGHCKTVVVLLSDYLFFERPFTVKSSFGIVLTLVGVFWYTSLKLEKARLEKEARERAESKLTEFDSSKQDILDDEKAELVNSREE